MKGHPAPLAVLMSVLVRLRLLGQVLPQGRVALALPVLAFACLALTACPPAAGTPPECLPSCRGVDLKGAYLVAVDLGEADFREANLSEAELDYATFRGSDLRGADLSRAVLGSASLSGADLRQASLLEATLRRANLSNARLQGADLRNGDGGWPNLLGAVLDDGTRLADKWRLGWAVVKGGAAGGSLLGGALCEYFSRVLDGDVPDRNALRKLYAEEFVKGKRWLGAHLSKTASPASPGGQGTPE